MALKKGQKNYSLEKVFVENSSYSQLLVKRYYMDQCENKACSICDIKDWQEKPLILELDHINGINNDNRIENLRLLCPNCHSQTPTYKSKNGNRGCKKVSDKKLIIALKEKDNISRALQSVGLAPRGGNYKRAKNLIQQHHIVMKLKGMSFCIDCGDVCWVGAKRCIKCNSIKNRKVKRPIKNQLAENMKKYNWVALGKKYGVSDNAVRKWARSYQLI